MLVGRSAELAQLEALLAGARRSRGAARLLLGEPGVGKTVLLDAAASLASDFVVLRATGVEAESELGFSALADLLGPVTDRLHAIPPPQAAAVASALAVGPPVRADRFATYSGVFHLLAAAAEENPVLAVVDDARWLDGGSLEALAFAARRLGPHRIVLVLAARRDEGPELGSAFPELSVEPLDTAASRQLLHTAWPQAGPSAVDLLLETADGNPLALLELPVLLREDQLRGAEPLDDPLPPGTTIERAYARRLEPLSDATRVALLIAAASDGGDAESIRRALQLRHLDEESLEAAERARLVRIERDKIRFAHPLLRSVVYHGASAPDRRQAHVALAAALSDRDAERAWQLAAAAVAPDEQVADELDRVASGLYDRSSYVAAGRAYERAAGFTAAPEQRGRRLLSAAECLELAWKPDPALALLSAALPDVEDPRLRASIQHVRGRIDARRGNVVNARDLLIAEAERIARVNPTKAAEMLTEAAILDYWTERREEALATARRAAELAPDAQQPRLVLAALLFEWNDPESELDHRGLAELETMIAELDLSLLPLLRVVTAALFRLGRGDEAVRLTSRIVDRARESGALGVLAPALLARALCNSSRDADAAEALELARETGQTRTIIECLHVLGWTAVHEGRDADAEDAFADVSALVRSTDWGEDPIGRYALGRLALSRRHPEEAIDQLEPAAFDDHHVLKRRSAWAVDLVEAYVRAGRLDDARSTLAQIDQYPWPPGSYGIAVARCRALVAGQEDFDRVFLDAFSENENAGEVELARTELCYGERLRRARRRAEARKWLRSALVRFEQNGALPWAELTREELAATGERARRGDAALTDELTPKELQVARLVADGATNKEAAAKLFLSPKTIDYHLQNIYRRVGVRSRTELARLLD